MSADWNNDDRAESVRELVLEYRRQHYFHHMPGESEPSEPLGSVIGDIFANLMHLFDRLEGDDLEGVSLTEEGNRPDGAEWAERSAELFYMPEKDEEAQRTCAQCGESTDPDTDFCSEQCADQWNAANLDGVS